MEYLLILISIFFPAIFIYIFWVENQSNYYIAKLLGFSYGGNNNDDLARKMILQDIKSTKIKSIFVSCTFSDSHWNNDIIENIQKKLENGVEFVFLGSEEINNEELKQLAVEHKVTLLKTPTYIPFDFRIIDDKNTFISKHGPNNQGSERNFYRSFGNISLVNKRNETFENLKKDAAVFN